jgi:hypothetical protein
MASAQIKFDCESKYEVRLANRMPGLHGITLWVEAFSGPRQPTAGPRCLHLQ